jgi:hypothetical protein
MDFDRLQMKDIVAVYTRWCKESGTEPAGQKAVGKRLDDLNMRRQKIGGKYWLVGYQIKDEWMADRQCGRSGE